ncbi:MAG: hypothetical protein ACK559_02885, partial [bacterium]
MVSEVSTKRRDARWSLVPSVRMVPKKQCVPRAVARFAGGPNLPCSIEVGQLYRSLGLTRTGESAEG